MSALGVVNPGIFLVAVLLLNLTPGPDTAFIVGRSVSQGRAAGVVSALGISGGCIVHTLATVFGLTAILAASAQAFAIIKVAGAIYLIYLGLRMLWANGDFRSRSWKDLPAPGDGIPAGDAPRAASQQPVKRFTLWGAFRAGFVTNLLNPKVVLFFVSFFPQFVASGTAHHALAFLILGAIFLAMSTIYNCSLAWMAGTLTARIRQAPAWKRRLERLVGCAMIGLGVSLFLSKRAP